MKLLLRPFGWLSLRANQAVGAILGRLVYLLAPRYRKRLLANLRESQVCTSPSSLRSLALANAAEVGKSATELVWTLYRETQEAVDTVRSRIGWEAVRRIRDEGRAIVFVTPHLGAYDIMGRYLWASIPSGTISMYRPHKMRWLDALLREGRARGLTESGNPIAPANLSGVRRILKHLKAGGCTLVLPDQVPTVGEGEWVEFFGKPAYTMTLVGRLQQATNAAVVFCYAERLPDGQGFIAHFHPLEDPLPDDKVAAARVLNREIEKLVRRCPEQYLWAYNRYKRPAGAPPPPEPAR